MRYTHSRRTRSRSRFLPLLSMFALVVMLLGPLAGTNALAGEDPPVDEATEEPVEVQPTEVPPTEEPVEAVATEEPTEAPAVAEPSTLTITVYKCNHPTFDTGFSENLQMVLDTCREPGHGTFTVETAIATSPQSGQSLQFEVLGGVAIIESLPAGYDNPIADCYLYGPDGTLVDRIGPGETSGGGWKVGSIAGDVHCDWYQVDRGLGNVYIVNMACPSTAGLFPSPSMDELVQMCTEPAGQRHFIVEHGPGLERLGVSGGEFNDSLVEAVSTGPIAIRLTDPEGFDSARVFCQVFGPDQITQVAPFSELAVSNFRASGLTLVAQHRIHCSWFNIQTGPGFEQTDGTDDPVDPIEPTQTPSLSEFTVVKHTCPEDYDPEDDGANPMIDCPEGPNGITFTLSDDDPATADLQDTTGSSAPNRATFANLEPGDHEVTETVPDGVEDIFVLGCGGGGGVDPIPQFIDGSLTVGIPQGVIMTCHWFNISEDDDLQIAGEADSTPMTIAALDGTASLTIHKYECPAGFDVTTVDSNPSTACTTPGVGISFDIDDEIDDNAGRYIETGQDGTGTASDFAAGTYTIDEGVRNGTTSVFVWDCYDANGTSTRTDPLSMSSIIQIEIEDGAQIRCDWYNVVGGTSRVVVNKHACDYLVPAYTLSLEELRTQCTIDSGTIDFTVVSDTHKETQPASNNPLTLASFAGVPSGYVAVVEKLPDGWAIPIVSCQLFDENGLPIGEPSFMDVKVRRQVSFQVEPGQVMSCDWYNVAQG
ncbi:MAG TPA: hypothetical protein VD767_00105, partial [Thermomicrobiales bacterium]|nr:hypothetical protein [Thermomicrobiales bacterium]